MLGHQKIQIRTWIWIDLTLLCCWRARRRLTGLDLNSRPAASSSKTKQYNVPAESLSHLDQIIIWLWTGSIFNGFWCRWKAGTDGFSTIPKSSKSVKYRPCSGIIKVGYRIDRYIKAYSRLRFDFLLSLYPSSLCPSRKLSARSHAFTSLQLVKN